MSCLFLFLLSLSLYGASLLSPMSVSAASVADSAMIVLRDGAKSTPCATRASTVREFLRAMDLTLGELDSVSPELDSPIYDGVTVSITRREYVEHRETVSIPFQKVYAYSPDVRAGEEMVVAEGIDGVREAVYSRYMVNGEIAEQTLLKETILSQPTPEQIHTGFRSTPVSKLDFDAEFDENGEPLNYKSALRDQYAAAYTAAPGARTASGLVAGVGYVAVNSNVIPLGSKLFIQSADGTHIYGYAIAADTGGALFSGTIAVDCFYDTYEACIQHGIKVVDIFVLE